MICYRANKQRDPLENDRRVMKEHAAFTRAVGMIYQAAISPEKWDAALVAIAEAMGATQAALMLLEDGRLVRGTMPLMDPVHLQTYAEIKATMPEPDLSASPQSVSLGTVVSFDDSRSREVFESSFEYKEWWREHDLGIGALFANLSLGGTLLAQIGIYRSRKSGFSLAERGSFAELCDHLMRAGVVQRRLKLGVSPISSVRVPGHAGLLIVDREYRILNENDELPRNLPELRLVARSHIDGCLRLENDKLRKFVDDAQGPEPTGGSFSLSNNEGEFVWVDVMPVIYSKGGPTDWLNLDRPAAIIQFSNPEERVSLRVCGLAKEFGLTPAEVAVAIEIVKGDGRAATAKRLSISESTVRSHLSVIFGKVGVHRQSELIKLLV